MASGSAPFECPDPSLHSHKHSDSDSRSIKALGPDGKLSAAGAAASLKYAQAHELPAFPTVGIDKAASSNLAANLAHANQKPFEHWKPDLSSTAGKAALLAHKDGGKVNLWQPAASDIGSHAAGAALSGKSLSPELDYGYTDDGKKRALLAATLSVSGRTRPAQPEPVPSYPDAASASANALNAATVAHAPSAAEKAEPYRVSSPANEAARITHLGPNVNREMFTSHPDFGRKEEMSKKHALSGATTSVARDIAARSKEVEVDPPLMGSDPQTTSRNYLKMQEQAQKLAQERLAKLDPDGVNAYREHYGYANTSPQSKLSIRNRKGRSASNEEEEEEDDAANARRIRHQMSRFTDSVAEADKKKKQDDRNAVLAAAQRNVKNRMSDIDRDIFDQTGKITPGMMEQWEAKARAKAAGDSEKRLETHGLVHIGGGKYMDQSEITAIAQGRMQPILDEVNDNAEKQRERDEQIRLDLEERKRVAAEEKSRKEDEKIKAKFEAAQLKQQDKELKEQEKEEKRQQQEQRKQQDAQWKREQAEAKAKAKTNEDQTAKELSSGAGAGEYSATASGAPAAETTAVTAAAGAEAGTTSASKEDPVGVPTDFGHENPHSPEGAFHGDSGSQARKEENDRKLEEIGVDRSTTSKKAKRESRVRSFFGKFKRGSKHPDDETVKREDEAVAASEDPVKKAEEDVSKGKESTAAETAAPTEAKGAVVKDDDDEGLYTEPSHTEAAAAEKPVAAPAGVIIQSTTTHVTGADGSEGVVTTSTARDIDAETERPSTAKHAAHDSTATATTASTAEPVVSSVRHSVTTTSDEYEEARDRFDADDSIETATLRAGETAAAGETTASRPTSKFQEQLGED